MKDTRSISIKNIIEASLFVAEKPLSVSNLKHQLFEDSSVDLQEIKQCIAELQQDYISRGIQLRKLSSGYRFQTSSEISDELAGIMRERAPKTSQAMLETLSLIAYKQPITRSEIEQIRGVAVSSYIIKTLTERDWIKIVGHKDVPGRPALFATTKTFLNYFSLSSLAQLPEILPVAELSNIDSLTTSQETEV